MQKVDVVPTQTDRQTETEAVLTIHVCRLVVAHGGGMKQVDVVPRQTDRQTDRQTEAVLTIHVCRLVVAHGGGMKQVDVVPRQTDAVDGVGRRVLQLRGGGVR